MEEFEGFVYLNIDNPMVAWNTVRGSFCSADCLPEGASSVVSFNMAGLLVGSSESRLVSELAIEKVRRRHYPHQVSRLTGFFVFDDIESVAETWTERGWGGHFSTDYLTDVGVAANASSRVDANWITCMMNDQCVLQPHAPDMIHRYWQGEPSDEPVWERIVEGWLTVWGTEIKLRALTEIQRYWPSSLKLLEYSANAAGVGSADGQTMPLSLRRGNRLFVEQHLRMVDAESSEFLENMSHYYAANPALQCRIADGCDLVLPDFTMYNFSRPISF